MPGECTTLRWDVEGVQAVYLDGEGVAGHDARGVCPDRTTTYTLRAVTPAGDIYCPMTIRVPEISFPEGTVTITRGECVTLRWDVEYVRAVYLNGEGVAGHDSRQVCPAQSTTYTLHVITNCGNVDKHFRVEVIEPTRTPTPYPTPDKIAPSTPQQSEPANGQGYCCGAKTLTLKWSPESDPSGVTYTVEIQQRMLSTQPWSKYLTKSGLSTPSYTHTFGISYYRWRVRAVDGAGNASAYSDWWTFAVILG